jgi:hypothetical protein
MTLKHTYIPTKHQQTPHRDQLPKPSKNKTGQAKSLSHTQTHMNTHKQSKARKEAKWVQKQTCSQTVSSFCTKVNGKRIKKG